MRLAWLGGGIAALVLTLVWVDPTAIAGVLAGAAPTGLVAAAALMIASHVASLVRWRAVLSGLGTHASYPVLARWYLLGSFANSFLPSSVGGDAVRATTAARQLGVATAATSVIFDRLLGYLAVLACGALALLGTGTEGGAGSSIGLCAAAMAAGILVLAWAPGRRAAARVVAILPAPARRLATTLLEASARAMSSPGDMAVAAVAALVVQVACAAGFVLLGRALGVSADALFLIAVYSVSTAASALPLSIGGLGVRETVVAAMFLHAGLEPSAGVAVSLAWFGLATAWSATSGLLYLLVRAGDHTAGASTVPRPRNSIAEATSAGHHCSS
ncbi:MAG TPA: lysylphosphatidylglycerol synthase transmembrane domain-containing protein [Kofleriaceae bacterium]|nr:lysylphosphatidylglycerol synthase transmembrane domain-containing protein [Kofleriaceae bacterium]